MECAEEKHPDMYTTYIDPKMVHSRITEEQSSCPLSEPPNIMDEISEPDTYNANSRPTRISTPNRNNPMANHLPAVFDISKITTSLVQMPDLFDGFPEPNGQTEDAPYESFQCAQRLSATEYLNGDSHIRPHSPWPPSFTSSESLHLVIPICKQTPSVITIETTHDELPNSTLTSEKIDVNAQQVPHIRPFTIRLKRMASSDIRNRAKLFKTNPTNGSSE